MNFAAVSLSNANLKYLCWLYDTIYLKIKFSVISKIRFLVLIVYDDDWFLFGFDYSTIIYIESNQLRTLSTEPTSRQVLTYCGYYNRQSNGLGVKDMENFCFTTSDWTRAIWRRTPHGNYNGYITGILKCNIITSAMKWFSLNDRGCA